MLRALGDPYLVADFQRFFGLQWKNDDAQNGDLNSHSVCQAVNGTTLNGCAKDHRKNGYVANGFTNSHLQHRNVETSETKSEENFGKTTESHRYEYKLFYHILFSIGAGLGDELFYITFFSFLFWNVDEYLARRVVVMWALTMYLGQTAKDIIRWPRPASPPVVRAEERFSAEFGMPSTHAMGGTMVPFCLVYFTYDRYEYPLVLGVMLGIVWCLLVCSSRLYFGMHNLQDIFVGVTFALIIIAICIPYTESSVETLVLTSVNAPIFMVLVPLVMIFLYPSPGHYTCTRGDTAMILGVACGVLLASWANYRHATVPDPYADTPYPLAIPDVNQFISSLARFVIGVLVLFPTRYIVKTSIFAVLPKVLPKSDVVDTQRPAIELPYRFLTYTAVGFNGVYLVPHCFRHCGF